MSHPFEDMLTGGHPNSLGRTEEVVAQVLENPDRIEALYACYGSADAVVRLRTSSAFKRVAAVRPDLVMGLMDRLLDEIGMLDQASAQWTLAQLFQRLSDRMTPAQRGRALAILKRNLAGHDDWIVLNTTIDTLTGWAKDDPGLARWLHPHLDRLRHDSRKSVAGRAAKAIRRLADG